MLHNNSGHQRDKRDKHGFQKVFRIGCYNVHNFTNGKWKITTPEIADILGGFDISGLQEVDGMASIQELKRINKHFQTFYSDSSSNNGIVMSLRPKGKVMWLQTYKFKLPYFPRGVVSLQMLHNDHLIHIYVTHLDHRDEQIRMCQLEKLMDVIKEESQALYRGCSFPHLIMGDFNALTRSDYTDEQWEAIRLVREKNEWESPTSELMSILTDKLGYHDIIGDYCKRMGISVPLTSRFDTRVDYILASAECINTMNFINAGAIQSDASDHLPIFADIIFKSG